LLVDVAGKRAPDEYVELGALTEQLQRTTTADSELSAARPTDAAYMG
jgi:hypothetical protein